MSGHIPGKLIDGLFRRVLAPDLTEDLGRALVAEGLDLGPTTLEPHYAREVWYRALAVTAAALFPGEAPPEQLRQLGRHVVRSLVARRVLRGPWLPAARLLGPRRAVRQLAGHLDGAPVTLAVTERSRTALEVLVSESEQPEFLAGLLEAACVELGASECRVTVEGCSTRGTVLLASWR